MKKVLIFGIGGFTGQHFSNFIVKNKLYDNFIFYGADLHNSKKNSSKIVFYEGDCTNTDFLEEIITEIYPDYIINLIGKIRGKDLADYNRINVEITASVFEIVLKNTLVIEKILLIGSAAEYGIPDRNPIEENDTLNPVNLYGLSKVYQSKLAEYYYRIKNLPVVLARTFNIVGDGISTSLSIGNFIKQISELPDGGVMSVGNLSSYRDFLSIEEVVEIYWDLLLKGKPGEVYNVCSGTPRKIEDVLIDLIEKSGKNINYVVDPNLYKDNDVEKIYGANKKYYDDM